MQVDSPQMGKETASGFQKQLLQHQAQVILIQYQQYFRSHQYPFAHQVSNKMDSETACLNTFQSFANKDISVMETEIVSKLLQMFLLHH